VVRLGSPRMSVVDVPERTYVHYELWGLVLVRWLDMGT
jgi:hypothetical protein